MIVCVCRRVSHLDIERQARAGCGDFDRLRDELDIGNGCGSCLDCARDTFDAACRTAGPAAGSRGLQAPVHFHRRSAVTA